VKVEFYGNLGERIAREIDVPFSAACTVADLRSSLAEAYPNAADEIGRTSVRACVDEIMVPDSHALNPESRVAFFPPLSGG
jgi:molybdopterin converting factor small subunit